MLLHMQFHIFTIILTINTRKAFALTQLMMTSLPSIYQKKSLETIGDQKSWLSSVWMLGIKRLRYWGKTRWKIRGEPPKKLLNSGGQRRAQRPWEIKGFKWRALKNTASPSGPKTFDFLWGDKVSSFKFRSAGVSGSTGVRGNQRISDKFVVSCSIRTLINDVELC